MIEFFKNSFIFFSKPAAPRSLRLFAQSFRELNKEWLDEILIDSGPMKSETKKQLKLKINSKCLF